MLNGLYGFFGRKPIEKVVECVNSDDLDDIIQIYPISQIIDLDDSDHVVVCRDILPSKDRETTLIELPKTMSNVAIASAITAYARIHLYSFIDKLPGELYYVDTDSIITDQALPSHLIGDNIGQMKDELKGKTAEEGYFLASKLYGLKLSSQDYIIKSKGVPKGYLTFDHFRKLYEGETQARSLSFPHSRFFKKLHTLEINNSIINITLSRDDSNTKFVNIYDRSGKWISTKPIHISYFSQIVLIITTFLTSCFY